MRVLLVQPPQSDPGQPYSSLGVLLSAWRHAGLDTSVADMNLDFFNYLCSSQNLHYSFEQVERRLVNKNYREEKERLLLEQALASADWLDSMTQKALKIFKSRERFYDPHAYAWALRTIKKTLSVVSAPAYPGSIGLQSFKTAHSYLSSHSILKATEDNQTNLFIRYCDDIVRDRFELFAYDVIAISVTFQTQIIPAWTLASKIKQWYPHIKVVVGGATISRIREHLPKAPHLFKNIDAFVLFEGETAFPALLDEWSMQKTGLDAPNIMVLNQDLVKTSGKIHVEDLNAIQSPDHRGLPLDDYWWPEPALLLNSARGCYYGRCTFCMISPSTWGPQRMGKSYRLRTTDKIVQDMIHVHKQTGTKAFNLANDVLSPRTLAEIGEALTNIEYDFTWDSEIRLERGLNRKTLEKMAAGGCRHLRFGFETASERIGKLMDKGTDVEINRRIISDCKAVGITTCLLTQVAFPGETLEEAEETLSFLCENNDKIAFLSLTQFVLEEGSGVHQNPSAFNISLLPNEASEDLSWMLRYIGPNNVTVTDGSELYEKMESILDRYYPDRDLFFKGGLGHAHTTLYTRRYKPEDFIAWNQTHFRYTQDLQEDTLLETSRYLSIRHFRNEPNTDWSSIIISSGEVPEYSCQLNGSYLLLLLAASKPTSTLDLVQIAKTLSGDTLSHADAKELVQNLYDGGLLLKCAADNRAIGLSQHAFA